MGKERITAAEVALKGEGVVKKADFEIATIIGWLDAFTGTRKIAEPVKNQFLEVCKAYHLNPVKREIHLVPFWDKDLNDYSHAIVIGYEVYLKRAERTGLLDGWECHTEGEIILENTTYPEKGVITIWRKDHSKPFMWEVFFKEVAGFNKKNQLTKFWWKSPSFQLRKVTIGQGMRLCFPDEMGGMAYEYAYANEYDESQMDAPIEPGATEEEPAEPKAAEPPSKKSKAPKSTIPAITIEPEDMPAEPSQTAEDGRSGAFVGKLEDIPTKEIFAQIVAKINADREMPAARRIDVINRASEARKGDDVSTLKKILGELNGKTMDSNGDSDGTRAEGADAESGAGNQE